MSFEDFCVSMTIAVAVILLTAPTWAPMIASEYEVKNNEIMNATCKKIYGNDTYYDESSNDNEIICKHMETKESIRLEGQNDKQ